MELKLIGLVVIATFLLDSTLAQERIYGGKAIDITEAPYMVHLYHLHSADPDDHKISMCGGAILRPNLILTAAHCVADKNNNLEPFPPDFFYVIAGTREGGTEPSDGTIHQVKTVFRHPKFKGVNSDTNGHHDVGLLELVDEIELGEKSQLVELAHEDDRPAVGTDCKLAGWGKNPDHPGDKSLYQIHFNIISSQECYDEFASDEVDELEKHEICAQAPGRNECPGDSGGPLIDTTTNRQIGIVSYGAFDCTSDDTPGVLTRVTDNLDYINEVIEQTSSDQ